MSRTKTTVGVVVEPGFLASWASTMESRLSSCLTRSAHHEALNGRFGHPLVCAVRLSPLRKPMTSERAPRVSSVVLLRQ
jgi:hypothetical protein